MALITCPNCGREGISTKARFCVGCRCSMERINELLNSKQSKEKSPTSNLTQKRTISTNQFSILFDKLAKNNNDREEAITWLKCINEDIDDEEPNVDDEKAEVDTDFDEKGVEGIDGYIALVDDVCGDFYDEIDFNESVKDVEDYLNEYKECLDSLFNDDWFYPDYDKEEKYEDSFIPIDELEEFDDDGYDVYKDCPELLDDYEEEGLEEDFDY